MSIRLIVHRGTHEIGGSCVELASETSRILIDAGLPLSSIDNRNCDKALPASLVRRQARSSIPLNGILISHPHQDHYGLLRCLSPDIPVYTGKATAALIRLSLETQRIHDDVFRPLTFSANRSFMIGDFTITPYLVDHSGFDSYAFLITCGNKRLLYTGDFREHGYKGKLIRPLIDGLPEVDALILEGTLIGQDRSDSVISEADLIEPFTRAMKSTEGIVFVTVASTNIDRLVTLIKACNKAKRMLAIDPYTAEVLDRLNKVEYGHGNKYKLPHPSWSNIRVCYPDKLCAWLENNGNDRMVVRHRSNGEPWAYFKENEAKMVMLARPSSSKELFGRRYFDLSKARWIYSMWPGYLEKDKKLSAFRKKLESSGTVVDTYLHTSGHASMKTLKNFAAGVTAKAIIPIHTENAAKYKELFTDRNVVELQDGQELEI